MGRRHKAKNKRKRQTDRANTQEPELSQEIADRLEENSAPPVENLKLCPAFRAARSYLDQVNFTMYESRLHGRAVSTYLEDLRSLWPAAVGGSRITLLVQVCKKHTPSRRHRIYTVRDAGGQEVMLHISRKIERAEYISWPGDDWIRNDITKLRLVLLRVGHFVVIKGAKWTLLEDGSLGLQIDSHDDFTFFGIQIPPEQN